MPTDTLLALSPLDGRYQPKVQRLSQYFSEFALIRYRMLVEVEYLISLLGFLQQDLNHLGPDLFVRLRELYEQFSLEDAHRVKELERRTNHDVKAVEYFLKERLMLLGLQAEVEKVHFGLTSEDVNNLAIALMVQEAVRDELLPALAKAYQALRDLAARTKSSPMLARTHGQPASPTTMGKELAVYMHRLAHELEGLHHLRLTGKLNGATGTFGALHAAYPDRDWIRFSADFVARLGLVPNLITTQIEPHDRLAALCDQLRRIDHVWLDLVQDMWRYISDGYFRQQVVATEVGSSAMPHKVNPIDFENAEGNLGLANALLVFFGEKLTKSRLQRDLSDSTVLRNLGTACGHVLLAADSALRGLKKLQLDGDRLLADLDAHPEVLAEAYQTILRAEGHEAPYERLKDLTRGEAVTLPQLHAFIRNLELAPALQERLLALTPATYLGQAVRLTELALTEADELLLHLEAARG